MLFGNDGYSNDERPQAEAAAAVARANELDCEVSDIQTDEMENYSWATAVDCDKLHAEDIYNTMSKAWAEANEKRKADAARK